MSDENIVISVEDKVSLAPANKLRQIAKSAREAHSSVSKLIAELAKVSSAVGGLGRLVTEASKAAISQQRLATEIQKTAAASMQAEAALNRAVAAETAAKAATERLTAEKAKLALAEQRVATEQQKTATATARATAAQSQAELQAARTKAALDRMNASNDATSDKVKTLTSRFLNLKNVIATVAITLASLSILKTADEFTTLQNKLQNVTTSMSQVNTLTERLFEISNRARADVISTATSFARFDRSLKYLGKSQEDTLRMTETINKAFIISGTTAQEAASAMLQLSQGFNAGKLQGDEFRSISENMPIVLDYVAKAMNKPIAAVKQLSTEGKITAEVLYNAFELMGDRVNEVFAKTTPTISQAMIVANNNWIKFVGSLDKSLGITAAISKSIIALSNNFKALAVGAVAVGASLLVAFGPVLLNALNLARAGVLRLTLAIASNPIGLLLVALSAVVAYLAIFSNEIKVSSDGLLTLRDYAVGAFNTVASRMSSTVDTIKSLWNTAIDFINEKTNGFGENFRDVFGLLWAAAKGYVNFLIGSYAAAFGTITTLWKTFPTLMKGIFNFVVNLGQIAAEKLINTWQTPLTYFSKAVGYVNEDAAKSIDDMLNSTKVSFERLDTSGMYQAGVNIATAFKDGYKDYAGEFLNEVEKNARLAAEASKKARDGADPLRGSGPNTSGATTEDKTAVKRAEALRRVNAELDNELSRMFMLNEEREKQAKFDEIQEKLLQKKITLNAEEKASIKNKIAQIQEQTRVQSQMDSIYKTLTETQQTYNDRLKAADILLKNGSISADQYKTAIGNIARETAGVTNQLEEFKKKLEAVKLAKDNLTQGERNSFAMDAVGSMGIDTSTLQLSQETQLQAISDYYAQVQMLRDNDLISEQDASNIRTQLMLQENRAKLSNFTTFIDSMATLQNSNIKALARIGKAAAIVQATINTYEGVTKALAQGGIWGYLQAGVVMAMGMSQIASIKSQGVAGFKSGGYTGDIAANAVAGNVHGKEYVFDAAATARIGVDNLDALRSGASQLQSRDNASYETSSGGDSSSGAVNITIEQTFNTSTLGDKQTEALITTAAKKGTQDALNYISNDFSTNGSLRKLVQQ